MVTLTEEIEIPQLPALIENFIPHLSAHQSTSISELVEPYKAFESTLREVYAQQPDHELVEDGAVNLVPGSS